MVADARFARARRRRRLRTCPRVDGAAGGRRRRSSGFERYDDALAPEAGDDIDDPVIGTRMLYTSGTTGRPKGVHRDASTAAPGAVTTAAPAWASGYRPGQRSAPPVHRPAVPRRAAAAVPRGAADRAASASCSWTDGMREADARAHRAPPRHAHAHGADDVPPPAVAAARGEGAPRPVVAALRRPRRRALPGAGEAGDHRLVGPDRRRVLRRHRGRRHGGAVRRLAAAPGHRRTTRGTRPHPHPRRRRQRRSPPARSAPST